ncbi:MAG: UDP-glucose/GDP-mannose dehydrogenase family protein [bacterium]
MNIAVIGVGYVGLVTGAVFADLGNMVICVDSHEDRIEKLRKLEMPFYEPGLEEMVTRNVEAKRLAFSTDTDTAVRRSEIVFIAVGTPAQEDGGTDLSQVEASAAAIGRAVNDYKIVVNKSTVPVGTGDLVKNIIERFKPKDVEVEVVSNPEFLAEGTAISDALSPDRIVIGAPSKRVAMKLIELYSALEKPMVVTSVRSAEMIKYASNAFLATKISFINSVANLCEKTGADIEEVTRGVGLDERIGSRFLRAGIGYGGSCFPKDTESLLYVSRKFGEEMTLVSEAIRINKQQPYRLIEKAEKALGGLKGKTIGALGLSFKPGTDDLRDSSALAIVARLIELGARVQAYDPMAMEKCKPLHPEINYCDDAYAAAAGADALMTLTEWNHFKQLSFPRLKEVMKSAFIFDGRNIYNPDTVRAAGFKYYGIGRESEG